MPSFLDTFGPRLKQYAFRPLELDSYINILHGSVRSGKTWATHMKILQACKYSVTGWRLLTGTSKAAIFNNVLYDLFNIVGPQHYQYSAQSSHLKLCGSNWIVKGAEDEGAEKFIRGVTLGVAVADELSKLPQTFFQMLLTRLSPKGARFYGTTNPDTPFHWLRRDPETGEPAYLCDKVLRRKGLLFSMHTTMGDNPNLTKEYIEAQKLLYKGVFYRRFILGEWVMAQGSIYKDAWSDSLVYDDDSRPVGLLAPGGHVDRWVAVDCGVDHPQVYLEFYDDGDTIWIENEYYWDSKAQMQQKTDAQYADDIDKFMGTGNSCEIRVPPEAASFRAELVMRGFWATNAENEVSEGIQTVMALMSSRKLRIHKRCQHTLEEIQTYHWDKQAAMRGIEQPDKKAGRDDAIDALRYGLHVKVPRWRFAKAA